MAIKSNWNSAAPASPALKNALAKAKQNQNSGKKNQNSGKKNQNSGANSFTGAGGTAYQTRNTPQQQPQQQQGGGSWLDQLRERWNSRWSEPAPVNNIGGYNAGFWRGTNANYGAGPTVPQGVSPNFHTAAPAQTLGAGNQNPMMGVRGGYSNPVTEEEQPRQQRGWRGNQSSQSQPAGSNPNVGMGANSFVSGDGLRANLGENGTHYIGPDWAQNYLSEPAYWNMYLSDRFQMLPEPDGGGGGFGSNYGGWGGWGGGGGGGGYGGSQWTDPFHLNLASWKIK